MKNLNHKEIEKAVCEKFNLTCYKIGKFTHFKNAVTEIGYIEKISSPKYLYTILINFFDFDNIKRNDKIVLFIHALYINQKVKLDFGKNYCLTLRGNTINKSTLI